MHEFGLTERLLAAALEGARQAGADRITAVHVALGHDAGVAGPALRLYWPQVRAGTPAARARLVIRHVPGDAVRLRAIDVAEPRPPLAGGASAQER